MSRGTHVAEHDFGVAVVTWHIYGRCVLSIVTDAYRLSAVQLAHFLSIANDDQEFDEQRMKVMLVGRMHFTANV
jgi:hypothetical protein